MRCLHVNRFTEALLAVLRGNTTQMISRAISRAAQQIEETNAKMGSRYQQHPLVEGMLFGSLCLAGCDAGEWEREQALRDKEAEIARLRNQLALVQQEQLRKVETECLQRLLKRTVMGMPLKVLLSRKVWALTKEGAR